MSKHPFKSPSFLHSVGYALEGLRILVRSERNFRIHLVITMLVVATAAAFGVSRTDWVLLLLCIGLMLAVEIMNTALEYLVDTLVGKEFHIAAKQVKDLSAAACLLTAAITGMAGILIFCRYF